jgi:hypothetical protein
MTFPTRLTRSILLGLIPALILAITPSVAAAQAQLMPSSYQTAQMQFLESYGTMPSGLQPTASEAWSVVQAYPTVPTSSELTNTVPDAPLVASSVQAPDAVKVASSVQAPSNCMVSNKSTKSPWYNYDITFKWSRGLSELFWICQNMDFSCNVNTGKIKQVSTFGNDGLTKLGHLLWHYVGYDTQDGMPKWIYTSNSATILFQQTFGWGYGPISGQYSFNMYITDTCNSWKNGGPNATGGYTS